MPGDGANAAAVARVAEHARWSGVQAVVDAFSPLLENLADSHRTAFAPLTERHREIMAGALGPLTGQLETMMAAAMAPHIKLTEKALASAMDPYRDQIRRTLEQAMAPYLDQLAATMKLSTLGGQLRATPSKSVAVVTQHLDSLTVRVDVEPAKGSSGLDIEALRDAVEEETGQRPDDAPPATLLEEITAHAWEAVQDRWPDGDSLVVRLAVVTVVGSVACLLWWSATQPGDGNALKTQMTNWIGSALVPAAVGAYLSRSGRRTEGPLVGRDDYERAADGPAPVESSEARRLYEAAARSPATLRAWRSDSVHFQTWCTNTGRVALPATPDTVAEYLASHAGTLKTSTLARRLSTIGTAHRLAPYLAEEGIEDPTGHPDVTRVWDGIRRIEGDAPTQVRPLLVGELRRTIDALDLDTPAGLRDRALLLIGFAGGFGRSELAALTVEDVEPHTEGLVIDTRQSRTDERARGRIVGIPYGSHSRTCPVRALAAWCQAADLTSGALWLPVTRHGHIGTTVISDRSVANIVKRAVTAAGFDPDHYAGHSLRAGLATSASAAGAGDRSIARQTGRRNTNVLAGGADNRALFDDNAAGRVGL